MAFLEILLAMNIYSFTEDRNQTMPTLKTNRNQLEIYMEILFLHTQKDCHR